MLKLEVGKFYKLRNGSKVQVLSTSRPDKLRPVVVMDTGGLICLLSDSGRYLAGTPTKLSLFDIIEEWREPLVLYVNELEVASGKYYYAYLSENSARAYASGFSEGTFTRVAVKMVEVKE